MTELQAWTILKGHSARVPGKNFRTLVDRPLWRWIVDTVLSLPEVERLVIDTDVPERLAPDLPADPRLHVHERDAALRGDDVSANDLLRADLELFPAQRWLMVHATSPFLGADTIRRALRDFDEGLGDGACDSLFGTTRTQTRFWRADGSAVNHDPAHLVPTQQLETWFEENSALYLFTEASFRDTGARVGARPRPFQVPRLEAIDLDTEDDWALAEVVARGLAGR